MPLRQEPHTLEGGCMCRAVRYQVSVPAYTHRPVTPYRASPGDDAVRIPDILVCHCNDCRLACSALPPLGLVTELATVTVSLASKSAREATPHGPLPGGTTFLPAKEYFDHRSSSRDDTFLACFKFKPERSRWFCSRCGTSIAYSVDPGVLPSELEWPDMLDVWLATLDRKYLEREEMRPSKMVHCDTAIPWVMESCRNGMGPIPAFEHMKIDLEGKYLALS